jgi:hypothetical protein
MAATYSPLRRGSKRSGSGTRRSGGNGAAPSGRSSVRRTSHQEAIPCEQHSAGETRHSSGQRQTPSDSQSASVSGSGRDQPLLRSNHAWVRRMASAEPTTTGLQDRRRDGGPAVCSAGGRQPPLSSAGHSGCAPPLDSSALPRNVVPNQIGNRHLPPVVGRPGGVRTSPEWFVLWTH